MEHPHFRSMFSGYGRLALCALLALPFTADADAKVPDAQFVICDDGSVDFGVAAKTGALRYYRAGKDSPLIEYFSLNEGELSQIRFTGAKWKYEWTDGKLQVNFGKVVEDLSGMEMDKLGGRAVIPPVTIAPENGSAEFELQGKLTSNWTETVKFSEGKLGRALEIRCKRQAPGEKAGQASFSVKFMRWIEEKGANFIAVRPDGSKTPLMPEMKVAVSKVLVSFPENGRRLELTAGSSSSVSLTKSVPSVGGRILTFDMEDPSDFKVEVADIETAKTRQAGNLTLGVNEDNGTSFLTAGAMPLLGVEAFESKASQALAGSLSTPAWTVKQDGSSIKASGRIANDWKASAKAANDVVSYVFEAPGKGDEGIRLKFPYWLVGSQCEAILPGGKAQAKPGKLPLRIGADMSFGEFREGCSLLVWLTNTEQMLLKFESPVSIKSYRDSLRMYSSPFDTSDAPDFFEKLAAKGAVHYFPPGGLELRPLSKAPLRFTVEYRQVCRPEECTANAGTAEPVKGIDIAIADSGATVSSPWWEVFHDKKAGGLMSSVKFKGGLGKNVLASPERIYLGAGESEFSSLNGQDVSFIVDGTSLIVKGKLFSKNGKDCGAVYVTHYDYSDVCVKRRTVIYSEKGMKINKLGVLRLDFVPELDECGYKPIVAAFRKAVFPGPSIVNGAQFGYGFLSVFKSGGEGMDFIPGAETRQWTNQIKAAPADRLWQISGNDAGGASIIIEPYSSSDIQAELKNSVCFDYYIGLPKLERPRCKQYFPLRYQSWWFKKDWIDDKVIAGTAKAGVNLALDGNYGQNWAGEPVPENFSDSDRKVYEAAERRVKAWHDNGVKVVPFIGKGLIKNNILPDRSKLMLWSQMGKKLDPTPTPWNAGMMCHASENFNDYYKNMLCDWAKAYRFDGFYFDFCYPQGPCCNFNHSQFEHSDVDGVVKFLQWSRATFNIVYGHTGYYPTIMCENLVDLTWVGEEINYWYSNDGRLPSLNQMRDYFCHIPNTQKSLDPHIVIRWRTLPDEPLKAVLRYTGTDPKEFACRMALCGLFSEANLVAAGALSVKEVGARLAPWLDAFSAFKGVDFTTLEFKDWKSQNAVLTGNSCVKAAVYWNNEIAYLVLGNPESTAKQSCKFKLNVKSLGWREDGGSFELTRLPESKGKTQTVTYATLASDGVAEDFDAFEYRVYKLRPANPGR